MIEQQRPILEKLGVSKGYKTSHMKTVTDADIILMSGVSGDFNPVHICEEFAKKTVFGGRIAHGVLTITFLSAAMAKLPGLVIFLSQSVKFLRPVRVGDTIVATAEVIDTRPDKGIVTLKNICTNQKGEIVLEGEAAVRLYELPAYP